MQKKKKQVKTILKNNKHNLYTVFIRISTLGANLIFCLLGWAITQGGS